MSKTDDDKLTKELDRIARLSNSDLRQELIAYAVDWIAEHDGFDSSESDRISEAYRRRL